MAVTGFWPVYRNLKATLDYADNPDKTTDPEYLDEDLYAALRYVENDNKTDRQVLVATHFNTGTYHNHFVVNPVNMWTGKKLEAKYEVYYKLRDMSDRICKEHGLSVVKNPQRHKTARSVYFAEKNGEPTRYDLMRRALDEALTMSSSWTELSAVCGRRAMCSCAIPTAGTQPSVL